MKFKITLILIIFNLFYATGQVENGKKIYISDWVVKPSAPLEQYELIYVDFWATWCAPCIASIPHTLELEEQFGDKILFLFLSDEPSRKIKTLMKRKNWEFPSAVDIRSKTIPVFNVKFIPHAVILTPSGKIIWSGLPSHLNRSILERLLKKYGRNHSAHQIFQFYSIEQQNNWKTFSNDNLILRYQEVKDAGNHFDFTRGKYYLSGNLNYIVSQIKNTLPAFVKNSTGEMPFYIFESDIKEERDVFLGLVQSFICREMPYKIRSISRETEVYVLSDGKDPAFLSSEVYDFEKGNNTALADEVSLTVDNATKKQIAERLSQYVEVIFIYEGKDRQLYDWNYIYNDLPSLLEQLKDSGFEVEKEKREIKFFEIIRK